MSSLPDGWEAAKFDTIFDRLQYGLTAKASAASNGTRFLRITDLQEGDIKWQGVPGLAEDVELDRYLLKDGDFVFARSGSVEKAARVKSPPQAVFASYLIRGRPMVSEFGDWLAYFVRSDDYLSQIAERAAGIGMSNVSAGKLGTVTVNIPPLAEQRRIVLKLDDLTARISRARADLDRVSKLIARYKQAILTAAFSGELTKGVRALDVGDGLSLRRELLAKRLEHLRENGAAAKEISATIDFAAEADLPVIPRGWAWMPVAALATKVSDGVHKKPNYISEGVPFVTVRNLTAGPGISLENCRYVAEEDHIEFCRRTNPEFGDILISKDGTLGVVRAIRTRERFSIFVSVALVKPVDLGMSDYLELAFQAPVVQDQMVGVGSGLQHIHLTDLRRDFIPVAPEAERAEIVVRVRRAFAEVDRLAGEAAAARRLIDRLEQAVLSKAFRGELVRQDAADEPAKVLLDRIRTERLAAPRTKRGQRAVV